MEQASAGVGDHLEGRSSSPSCSSFSVTSSSGSSSLHAFASRVLSPRLRVNEGLGVPCSSLSYKAVPVTLTATAGDGEGAEDCHGYSHVESDSNDGTRVPKRSIDAASASHYRAPVVFPSPVSPSPSAAASLLLFMRTGFLHRRTRHTRRFARRFLILDRHILFSFKTIPLRCSSVCAYTSHLLFARDGVSLSPTLDSTSSSLSAPRFPDTGLEQGNLSGADSRRELLPSRHGSDPSLPAVCGVSSVFQRATSTRVRPSTEEVGEGERDGTRSVTRLLSSFLPVAQNAGPSPSSRPLETQSPNAERHAEEDIPSFPDESIRKARAFGDQTENHSTASSVNAVPHRRNYLAGGHAPSHGRVKGTLSHGQDVKTSDDKEMRETAGEYSCLAVTTDWSAADLFDFSQATCAWDLRTARVANFSYDKQQKGFTWVLHAPNVLLLAQQQEQLRKKQRQQQQREQKLLLSHQKKPSRNEYRPTECPSSNVVNTEDAHSMFGNFKAAYRVSEHVGSPESGSTRGTGREKASRRDRCVTLYHAPTDPTVEGGCFPRRPCEPEGCAPSGRLQPESHKTRHKPEPSALPSRTSPEQNRDLPPPCLENISCQNEPVSQATHRRKGKLMHLREKVRPARGTGTHKHAMRLDASDVPRCTRGTRLKSDDDSNGQASSFSPRSSSSGCSSSGGEREEEEERLLLVTTAEEKNLYPCTPYPIFEEAEKTVRRTGDDDMARCPPSPFCPEDQHVPISSQRSDLHAAHTPHLRREASCPALPHRGTPAPTRHEASENLSYFDDLFHFPDLPPPATCMETLTFYAPDVVTAHDWVFALLACSEVGSPAALYVRFANLQLYSNACTDGLPHWLWPLVEWAEKKETERRARAAQAGALSVGVRSSPRTPLSRETSTAGHPPRASAVVTMTSEALSRVGDLPQYAESDSARCVSQSDSSSGPPVSVSVFPPVSRSGATEGREPKRCPSVEANPEDNTLPSAARAGGCGDPREPTPPVSHCSQRERALPVQQENYENRAMPTPSGEQQCPCPASPARNQTRGCVSESHAASSSEDRRNAGVAARTGNLGVLAKETPDGRSFGQEWEEEDRKRRADRSLGHAQPYVFNPWSLLPPPSSASCSLLSVVLHSFEGSTFPSGYTPYAFLSFQSSLYPCLLIPGAPGAPACSPFLPLPAAVPPQAPGSLSLFQKLFSRAAPHPVPPLGPCRFVFRPAPCLNLPVFFPSRNQQDLLIHLYAAPPPSQSPNVRAGGSGKKADKYTALQGPACESRSLASGHTRGGKAQGASEFRSSSVSRPCCFPPSSQGPPADTLAPFLHSLPSLASSPSSSSAVSLSLASPLSYYLGSVAVPSHLFGTSRRQRLSLPIYPSSSHPLEDACRSLPSGGPQQQSIATSSQISQQPRSASKTSILSGDRLEVSVLLPTLWANALQPVEEVFDTPQPFLDGSSVAARAASAADAAGGGGGSWLPVQQLLLQIKRLGRLRDRISKFCSLAAFIFEFTSPPVSFFSLFYLLFGLLLFPSRFLAVVLLPLLLLIVSRHPDAGTRLLSFLCDFPVFLLFTSQRTLASILCSARRVDGSADNDFPKSPDTSACTSAITSDPDASRAAQMLLLLIKHQHWWAVSPTPELPGSSSLPVVESGFGVTKAPEKAAEGGPEETGFFGKSLLAPVLDEGEKTSCRSPCPFPSVDFSSKAGFEEESRGNSEDVKIRSRLAASVAQRRPLYSKVNICSCFAPVCCPWLLPPPLPLLLLPAHEEKRETFWKDMARGFLSWLHWIRVLLAFSVAGGVLPASRSLLEMISEDFYCGDGGITSPVDKTSTSRVGADTNDSSAPHPGMAVDERRDGITEKRGEEEAGKDHGEGSNTAADETFQRRQHLEKEAIPSAPAKELERSPGEVREKPSMKTADRVLSRENENGAADDMWSSAESDSRHPGLRTGGRSVLLGEQKDSRGTDSLGAASAGGQEAYKRAGETAGQREGGWTSSDVRTCALVRVDDTGEVAEAEKVGRQTGDRKPVDPFEEVGGGLRSEQMGTRREGGTTAAPVNCQNSRKESLWAPTERRGSHAVYHTEEDCLPSARLAKDSRSLFLLDSPACSSAESKNPALQQGEEEEEDQQQGEETAEGEEQDASRARCGDQLDHQSRCECSSSVACLVSSTERNFNATASTVPLGEKRPGHRTESPHSRRRSHHRPNWRHQPQGTETQAGRESSQLLASSVGDPRPQWCRQSKEDKESHRVSPAHHDSLLKGVAQFARKWVKKHLHSSYGEQHSGPPVPYNGHFESLPPLESGPSDFSGVSPSTIESTDVGKLRSTPGEAGGSLRVTKEEDGREQQTRAKQREASFYGEGRGLLCRDSAACLPLAAGSVDLLQFGNAEDYFTYDYVGPKADSNSRASLCPAAGVPPRDNPVRHQETGESGGERESAPITGSGKEGITRQGERRARFSDGTPQSLRGGKLTSDADAGPRHPRAQGAEICDPTRRQNAGVHGKRRNLARRADMHEGPSGQEETRVPAAKRTGKEQQRGDEGEAFIAATRKGGTPEVFCPSRVLPGNSPASPSRPFCLEHAERIAEEPCNQSFSDRFIFPHLLPRFTPRDVPGGALEPPRDPPFTSSCTCWCSARTSSTSETGCSFDVLASCRLVVSECRSLHKTGTGGRQGPGISTPRTPFTESSTREKCFIQEGSSPVNPAVHGSGKREGRKAIFAGGFGRVKNHHIDQFHPSELLVFRPAPFDTPSSCAACLESLLILLTNRRPPPEVAAFVFSSLASNLFPSRCPLRGPTGSPSVLSPWLLSRSGSSEKSGGGGGSSSALCRFSVLSDAEQLSDEVPVPSIDYPFDTMPPGVPSAPSGGSSLPGGEFLTLYKDFRASASRFLVKLWRWVVWGEKMCNLFSWKNSGVTRIATILFAAVVLVLLAVPLQYILVLWVVHAFIAGQKRGLWNLLPRRCAHRHVEAAIHQIVSADRTSRYRRQKVASPSGNSKKRTASPAPLRADYGGSDCRRYAEGGMRTKQKTALYDKKHLHYPALLRFLTMPQLQRLQRSLWRRCRVWLSSETLWEALDVAEVAEAVRRGRTETAVSTSRWARPDWMTNLLMHAPTDVTHQPMAVLLRDSRSLFAGGELLPAESEAVKTAQLTFDAPVSAAVDSWEGPAAPGAEQQPPGDPAMFEEDESHQTETVATSRVTDGTCLQDGLGRVERSNFVSARFLGYP